MRRSTLIKLYFKNEEDPLEKTWTKHLWATHIKAHLALCKECNV